VSENYDEAIEGYDPRPLGDEANDPGPLTDEENQALEESVVTARDVMEPIQLPELDMGVVNELRALKPDQVPLVGVHYVIYDGRPQPVLRGGYPTSEDEHIRLYPLGDLDEERRARSARTLRQRYRGYLCGQLDSL
jgi:hypothetical protein